jgi:hypothetical protein
MKHPLAPTIIMQRALVYRKLGRLNDMKTDIAKAALVGNTTEAALCSEYGIRPELLKSSNPVEDEPPPPASDKVTRASSKVRIRLSVCPK